MYLYDHKSHKLLGKIELQRKYKWTYYHLDRVLNYLVIREINELMLSLTQKVDTQFDHTRDWKTWENTCYPQCW